MRLFVAIHFSPEVMRVLEGAARDILARSQRAKITRTENLHLTLAFIGETEDLAGAKAAIDSCVCPAFGLTIGSFGRFGDLYWTGIGANPALRTIAENVQNALRERGFSIEDRPWKPHVTLARQVQSETPLRIEVPETEMTVRRVSLMKSERINGKLTYTEVYGRDLYSKKEN